MGAIQQQMASRQEFKDQVNIKSRYLNQSEKRRLVVSPNRAKISISASGTPQVVKEFHINDVENHEVEGQTLTISMCNGRKYEIESSRAPDISKALDHSKHVEKTSKFVEQNSKSQPKAMDYSIMASSLLASRTERSQLRNELVQSDIGLEKMESIPLKKKYMSLKEKPEEIRKDYPVAKYFHRPEDWRYQEQTGKMYLMNEEWKENVGNIVGFLVKKFLTTGSFMGLSFPVFAMKPESILQTYAKSLGVAPKLFQGVKDHLLRMKKFISFIFTISLLHVDVRKAFNPTIGQTFQCTIAGGSYSAEQISHHPPISAFIYEGRGYKIIAQLQMQASIGMNSGEGRFVGDVMVEFKDGHWIKGKFPNGIMSGVMLGDINFRTYGASYVYDSNGLNSTYDFKNNSQNFEGAVGFLNDKAKNKFREQMSDQDRFVKFEPFKSSEYSRIFSRMSARSTQWVKFDDSMFYDFADPANMPYVPEAIQDKALLLKSDSTYRGDVIMARQGDLGEAQTHKQRIENEQRTNRKLRQKLGPKS